MTVFQTPDTTATTEPEPTWQWRPARSYVRVRNGGWPNGHATELRRRFPKLAKGKAAVKAYKRARQQARTAAVKP